VVNDILKPVTPDGMAGFDQYNQFYIKWQDREYTCGSVFHDVREKICCICGHGWDLTSPSLRDQTFLNHRAEHAHQSCTIRYEALQEFDFWYRAVLDAGFMFGPLDNPKYIAEGGACFESLPNGYWPKADPWSAKPWYRVRLQKRIDKEKSLNGPVGRTLRLGARKSVYHLEIEPGPGEYDYKLALELLGNEKVYGDVKVTMDIRPDGLMIHAHGKDKAREYLKAFAKILGGEKDRWGLK
jgi:hypothetical protein